MANRRIFDLIFRTKGFDKAKGEADGVNTSFDNLAKTAKTAAIGFVSFQTALKGVELAKLAANTETVRRSFGNLAKEPDKMLQAMKKATAGTISEMELMQKFNEASLLGLPLDRFDEMLNIARGAAQSTGQSMDFMLNSIVVALGRGSKLMLDNLGIMIDVQSANEKYAESLGKTADKLTDVEKKQAFVNEALRLGNDNLERSGGVIDSNIDKFGKFNASIEDLSARIGREFLPIVVSLAEKATDFMDAFDPKRLQDTAVSIGIVTTALGIYTAAQTSANVAAMAFSKALPVLVFTTIVAGISEVVKEMRTIQEAANNASQKVGLLFVGDNSAFGEANNIIENNADLSKMSAEKLGELGNQFAELAVDTSQTIEVQDLFAKANAKVADELKNRAKAGDLVVKSNLSWKQSVIDLFAGDETEKAYIESLKGSYAEFINQQFIQLENKEKEDAFITRFTKAYPQQAKALGLLTSAQKKQAASMKDNVQLATAFGQALGNAFDPEQSGAEAFQGFIINVITALQGVILASGAVSQALTTTFIPGLGVAGAIAALAALEAAKAGVRSVRFAQFGMDEMVSQPTLIMAGEAGPERVQVTPATRPSSQGAGGGLTLNFNGPVTNKEFIRDTVIPEIQRVQNLGLA